MIINGNSLTVIQLNDSHAYFDLYQEMFWQGGEAVYRPAGGYARIASVAVVEDFVPYSSLFLHT